MLSIRSIALATTAAAALLPAVASAKTYCVVAQGCSGIGEWSIQDALKDSASDTEPARIMLGEGTLIGNLVVPKRTYPVEIVGQGPEKTIFQPSDGLTFALELHGGSVSQVGFTFPAMGPDGPRGLKLADGASADHVRAVVLPAATQAQTVEIEHGGHIAHSHIDGGDNAGVTVSQDAGAGDASITDSFVRGNPAVGASSAGHTLQMARDHVVATGSSGGVVASKGTVEIEDSLVELTAPYGSALVANAASADASTLDGRRLTVVGMDDTTALFAYAYAGGGPSVARLTDSVVSHFPTRAAHGTSGDATIALARVDTWPAAPDKVGNAAFSDDGSFSADPLLDAFYLPKAGSPLIDAAAQLGPGESDVDVNGNPRNLDGDGNCEARPDIGAIEAPAGTCTPPAQPDPQPSTQPEPPAHDATAPVVTKVRLAHRRTVRFTVSEAARVTVRIKRAHHKAIVVKRTVPAGPIRLKLRHALPHGRYAIRVTAVDAAGNRGIRAAEVKVARV
jgi:hypothetical protein